MENENLGTGFCYTDQQLIGICNRNPHFIQEDRVLRTFFPQPEMTNSQDDKLLISHITRGKVVAAPFSGKCAPGKVMTYRRDARELKEFDFAHIHIKEPVELCRSDDPALRVRDDGTFEDSEDARWRMAQEKSAMGLRASAELTEYRMMRDIMLYGMMNIEGDDFPSYTVDLCRPETHTIDLTALGDGVCDPCFDVFAWLEEQTAKLMEFGASGPYDVLMDKVASRALAAHPQFRNWYDKCCQNYEPPEQGTLANLGPEVFASTKLLAASNDGMWRFWTTCGTICEQELDPATGRMIDVETPVMPEGSMLIIDRRAIRSRRMFAPIRRLFEQGGNFAGIRRIASPIWLSTKVDMECDKVDIHLWSKPLPILGCAGATLFAKIATKECVDALCQCPPLGVPAVEVAPAAKTATATKTAAAKE